MAREELLYDDDFEEDEDMMQDMYLTFQVIDRNFAVTIKSVIEIVVLPSVTEVPDLPAFVKGIINLRGKVIPLIDIRNRFNLTETEFNERTCVIIIESNKMQIGLIVDSVNEVIKIPKDNMEPPPKIGESYSSRFIEQVGKVGTDVKLVLNLEKLLNEKELEHVKDLSKSPNINEIKEPEKINKEDLVSKKENE